MVYLKGHGNEADFLGFLQKLVPHRSRTPTFEQFRFWLKFLEIFIIEKRLPDSASRRLSDWATFRLVDSPTRRVGESAFDCLKENLASRRVGDSLTRRLSYSASRRLSYSASRRLSYSASRGVANSPTGQFGESILNGYTSPLKDQFGKK
jgi:hypothetical protein